MSEMIEVETREATGPVLDWLVAKAVKQNIDIFPSPFNSSYWPVYASTTRCYQPSVSWQQGGPLIAERVTALNQSDYGGWWAHSGNHVGEAILPLVAAMRAIVASKLGDTVEVPKELIT